MVSIRGHRNEIQSRLISSQSLSSCSLLHALCLSNRNIGECVDDSGEREEGIVLPAIL